MYPIAVNKSILLVLTALIVTQLANAQSNLALDEAVLSAMARENIPGLSLAVISEGDLLTRSYGERRVGSGLEVNNETIFEAASLTKPVFALVVLYLERDGLIELDRPLHEYIDTSDRYGPDFFESDDYRSITARMVLSHTSGLPNGPPTPGAIHFEPGTRFAYSGTGFRYLYAAVQQITGQALTPLVEEYVFGPLEMTDSSFIWQGRFQANTTWGHDENGLEDREILHLESEFPEGGLVTNINDYGKFIKFFMDEYNSGNALIRSMLEPTTEARDYGVDGSMFWSLGWGIEDAGLGNRFWHTGSNGSFKSFALFDPEIRNAMILFMNAENGLEIIPGLLEQTIGSTLLSDDYQRTISESMAFRPLNN